MRDDYNANLVSCCWLFCRLSATQRYRLEHGLRRASGCNSNGMLSCGQRVRMAKAQNSQSGNHLATWQFLLVILTVSALTGSLVTRTLHLQLAHSILTHSKSPHAVRQHLDRDASRWMAPVPHIAALQVSTFYPRMVAGRLPLPCLLLDENLCNRPPPVCQGGHFLLRKKSPFTNATG